MRILSFDPGGTTGWAYHDLYQGELTGGPKIEGGQIGPDDHHAELWELIYRRNPDLIIYEQFDYRLKKDKQTGLEVPGIVLVSKEYIGIIKLWHQKMPKCKIHAQSSSYGGAGGKSQKAFWTDEKLKVIGVYVPGCPHENDAKRHLLMYVTEGPLQRKDYLHMFKPKRVKSD